MSVAASPGGTVTNLYPRPRRLRTWRRPRQSPWSYLTHLVRAVMLTVSRAGAAAADPEQGEEDSRRDDVEDQLVVELDRAEDVGPGRARALGDQAEQAEKTIDRQRREHDRDEHQGGDPQGEGGAVVLAVGEHDRDHDQVGEDEG